MRFVKTSAVALSFAAVSIFGAGMAHAEATTEITEDLIACAVDADVTSETLAELHDGLGQTVELTADAEADLTAGNCL